MNRSKTAATIDEVKARSHAVEAARDADEYVPESEISSTGGDITSIVRASADEGVNLARSLSFTARGKEISFSPS